MMIIVTGSAGFIGFHLSKKLLDLGYSVLGVDSMTDYYDVNLKIVRKNILGKNKKFTFLHKDINAMTKEDFRDAEVVFHEAAYAGVRHSVEHPMLYHEANVTGTMKLLQLAVDSHVKKFMFASSSSVYGEVTQHPTPESYPTNPLSPYGATKLAAEKYCNAFFACYGLPTISLRYFTVYGPYGRPDMLIMKGIASCLQEKPILMLKKNGKTVDFSRDFSYIDDVVDANIRAMNSSVKNDVFNVGTGSSVTVDHVIDLITKETGKKPHFIDAEPNPADPLKTLADISHIRQKLGFMPKTSVEEGIKNTIKWYMNKKENPLYR